MRRVRFLLLTVLAAGFALSLAGCAGGTPPSGPTYGRGSCGGCYTGIGA